MLPVNARPEDPSAMHPGTVTQPVGSVGAVHLELGVGLALEMTEEDTTEETCDCVDEVADVALDDAALLLRTAELDAAADELEMIDEDARDDDATLEALELEATLEEAEPEDEAPEDAELEDETLLDVEPEDEALLEAERVEEATAALLLAEVVAALLAIELDTADDAL